MNGKFRKLAAASTRKRTVRRRRRDDQDGNATRSAWQLLPDFDQDGFACQALSRAVKTAGRSETSSPEQEMLAGSRTAYRR